MIVLSTICCNCWSFKLLPTIIFNTKNSSPFEMRPSRSISYTLKATEEENTMCQMLCLQSWLLYKLFPLTPQFFFSTSLITKCTKTSHKFLKVDCTTAADEDHEKSQILSLGFFIRDTHSSSKIAIIRSASGLFAMAGIWRNSSLSIDPDPSLSNFINLFFKRWISGPETTI